VVQTGHLRVDSPLCSLNKAFIRLLSAACFGILAIAVGRTALANNVDGAWSPLTNWPLISIHAALTPDKRVLTYGTKGDGTQTGYFIYDVWDYTAGLSGGHMTLDNMTTTDIFCSSQIILPQSGEILIAGGDNWTGTGTTNQGNNNSNIFDYGNNTLAASGNMHRARWYSSSTVLVNGEIYIQGGNGGGDRPEVREIGGGFRLLSGANTSGYAAVFPRNFLAPDGRVFGYDTNGNMFFVSTGGTGSIAAVGSFNSLNAGWTSGAAMFQPGRILQIGGNSNLAGILDITGPQPIWTATAAMSTKRQWVSATVLADGKVLATNGSEVANQLTNVNTTAEIWDPGTGQWHVGASGVPARLYHSSALLLPDATVLVAGGGAPGPLVNTNAEIYSPPYLYDGNNQLATRPQIISAPATANVGDVLAVQVDSDISRTTLVKSGSVTHSVNMDQRFIELPFTQSVNMLSVNLPGQASTIPPGYYLLFTFDNAGVPSVAHMLRILIDPSPDLSVDYTQTIGGGGGGPFRIACAVDEIVAGVHGNAGTYVNQIGPQCVKVDQLGRWIDSPVNGPVTGTTTSGTPFTKTCLQDFAVSGFQGRADQYVNQLDFQCRALTGFGGLAGPEQYLGAVGGGGGNAVGPFICGTNNPVDALYGRSGGWTDSFGVECEQAVITPVSINSVPVVVNPGPQTGAQGIAVNLPISASDGDEDELTFSAIGLPDGLSIDPSSGLISGNPTTAALYNVTVTVTDGTDDATADFTWDIAVALPLTVDPMPPQPSQLANTVVNYTASAHDGVNVMYKWNFGDGTPETAYSSSPSIAHTFTQGGIYTVALTVDDDVVPLPIVEPFVQTIHLSLTANQPARSTKIAYEERSGANSRVWVVNQDNATVSVIDAVTDSLLTEIGVGSAPRSVAVAADGRIWVTNKSAATISVIDPTSLTVVDTIALPHASQPYGLVFSPLSGDALVTLEATGRILKLDGTTGAQTGAVAVGPHPRGITIDAAGTKLYVSRFVTPPQVGEDTATVVPTPGAGGEVVLVDAASLTVLNTIILAYSTETDAENQGSGVPNYLGAVAISPDGSFAAVPSKQDNIGRGTLRHISNLNINFQNTVRSIGSFIDTGTDTEVYAQRIDFDNSSVASAAVFEGNGIYGFFALETSREVAVVNAHGKAELFRIPTGRTPQGVAVSADGLKLFVYNFMDRSVGIYDLTDLKINGQHNVPLLATVPTVGTETLSPQVLLGKQLFYDAWDTRLARDKYLSCAACHNDGGQDGRVWDLTGMGEGIRNTIKLNGTGAAEGMSHWSQNFDEIQDFEGQIRALSEGTGLMADVDFNAGTTSEPLGDPKAGLSTDLDALAAYVASLDSYAHSPHRNSDTSLTAAAVIGMAIFQREDCAACHSGTEFTDSDSNLLHDIGTLTSASGTRLGGPGPLPGVDTPSLRGVWNSAPYLHDGSAHTLAAAVAAHDTVALNPSDTSSLIAYLEQIDVNAVSAPMPDTDGDGVSDVADNCTLVANGPSDTATAGVSQNDSDGDNYGNMCDGDLDGSGSVNFADLEVFKGAFNSADPHADLDGSGGVNFIDLVIFKGLFNKAPGPSGIAP
jgi:YVTN family beta-propeller protein